jgi:hypothetical protein
MSVLPNFHGSTTFNNRITSYDALAWRIRHMLGEPLIQVEISNEQMYQVIDTACEYFTKFAGTTEEFLVFKSDLYVPGVGLPVGRIINSTPEMTGPENPDQLNFPQIYQEVSNTTGSQYTAIIGDGVRSTYGILHSLNTKNIIVQVWDNVTGESVFVQVKSISNDHCEVSFDDVIPLNSYRVVVMSGISASAYTAFLGNDVNNTFVVSHNLNSQNVIIQVYDQETDELVYPSISNISPNQSLIGFRNPVEADRYRVVIMTSLMPAANNPIFAKTHSVGWDFDMNNYRKVVDVYSFAEGNNAGINTLFSIEHTVAQQAYFGHLLGNVGYDLITWQALKGWLDLREKVLAMTPYLRFYPESQMLKIIPEPNKNSPAYYGLIGCHLQKPIKDIVSQLWVYRYALALVKITVAHTRGKYGGTTLFGGQTVSYQDLMSQGIAERDKLEDELMNKHVDTMPARFFIG